MTRVSGEGLVTVIIPFFNEEKYLADAVESVVNQTYPEWEIVLADDGSSDRSATIGSEFQQRFPDKIKMVGHPDGENHGLPSTRNLALRESSGPLIALLDADDAWLPGKLEFQVAVMRHKNEVAMVCNASLYWSSWQQTGEVDRLVPVGGPQDQVVDPPTLMSVLYPLGQEASPCPCSMMIRREAVLKHGGFEEEFDGQYQMYEDQAFLSKLYLNESVFVASQCLDKYRQRPGSLVSSGTEQGRYHQVRAYYLSWLGEYLERHDIRNRVVWDSLSRAQARYQG